MEEIKYENKTVVCISRSTGKYSIRKEGYLFWTGIDDDNWVEENYDNRIWETDNKELCETLFNIVQQSLITNKPISELLSNIK